MGGSKSGATSFRRAAVLCVFAALLSLGSVTMAEGAGGPLYDIKATWGATNLPPGGAAQFTIQVRNMGEASSEEALSISDKLPTGVTVTKIDWSNKTFNISGFCGGVGTETVSCNMPGSSVPSFAPAPGSGSGELFPSPSGYMPTIYVDVSVSVGATGDGINTATVTGGGAVPASDVDQTHFSSTTPGFGVVDGSFESDIFGAVYPLGSPSRKAGDRPVEQRVNFDLNAVTGVGVDATREITSVGTLKTVEVTLPRGMVGNPEATPKCDPVDFTKAGAVKNASGCPSDTQVGYLNVAAIMGESRNGRGNFFNNTNEILTRVPIYNLEPPTGVPADFGFNAGGYVQGHIYPELDPAQNYAIKTVTPEISSLTTVRSGQVTFWGVPADPTHNKFRYYPQLVEGKSVGAPWGTDPIRPLLTNPMDCGFDNGGARLRIDSYNHPGEFTPVEEYGSPLNVTGCDDPRIRFEPDIALQPTSRDAGGPTGLDVHLEVPQRSDVVAEAKELYAQNGNVKGIATPPIKKAVVTFPEGMTISPSAAQGLSSCSSAQIGLGTNDPVRCPDSSQYGTLTIHTPILPESAPPKGFIYIAKQNDNPFHNFLSLYLVIEERQRGILVKIPGRVDLNPETGQIVASFDDLPQFPVSDMQMSFKGGVRAALVNPSTCGSKTITAEFFSWSDPSTPHVVNDNYDITQKPDGSPCVKSLGERSFKPSLEAGTLSSAAGSYSPFVFRLTRSDDDQEFSQVGVTLPPGLSAKIAGVGQCSDAGIAQAEIPGRSGAEEESSPSCPASSLIGTTQVGAGVGVPLTYVPGKLYLAGPYKGAPLSMVVITPAVVGPYDLGVIAVRSAVRLDSKTTQVTVTTDPLPQIFKGIPVRIRDIRVKVDRPGTTLNPTSCAEMSVSAHVTGTGGDLKSVADDSVAELSQRYQAASCADLGFKPQLFLRLFGATHRGAHPRFRAELKARPGDANIGAASVALPHSEFLDQGHIRTVCTRPQFAAKQCPAGSVYGHAEAITPLLDKPVSGPVYLRSSSNPLPDLVAALRGPDNQPIEVELAGRIDSIHGGIRNTFDLVPDAPVTRFVLTMQGGDKGLLVNSRDLCVDSGRATARFTAQNGKTLTLRPRLQNSCSKKRQHRRHAN